MNIIVERYSSGKEDTLSNVYLDGVKECVAIEDEFRKIKLSGETRIPDGRYKMSLRWSPKFSKEYNHEMLWVTNVPGFEYILLHWGNTDLDTDGCLIVGSVVGSLLVKGVKHRAVLNSRKAYLALYAKVAPLVKAGKEVWIEYKTIG